ncbi:MAG: hypothetical protein ACKV0T_19830 [Planctomycetales bacterium]
MSQVQSSDSNRSGTEPAVQKERATFRSIARFLYSQNPFYLLSVAFVLHSTKLWFQPGQGSYNPWPLMGVITGYITLVAATGFLLVRIWRVWDDARSILLILCLLYVELSLTFDTVVISQPGLGRTLLLTGLLFSALVSEAVLAGLKIRLPLLFRVPFHLFLVLLFLYPLVIVGTPGADPVGIRWRILAFSPIAALVLVTLIPAIHHGPEYVRNNGTPWRWPLYPWSLFVFLIVCVVLRGYAVCLSFDPVLSQNYADAMRLQNAFGGYFFVPMVFALGLLLLEAGCVGRSGWCQFAALVAPVIALRLAIPDSQPGVPYAEFLQEVVQQIGSPVWLASLGMVGFYGWALFRRVPFAGRALIASMLVASVIGRGTVDWWTVVSPQPLWLWMAASSLGIAGFHRRDSRWAFVSALCAIAAFRALLPAEWHWMYRNAIPWHMAGVAGLVIGALSRDWFATWLRKAGVPLLVATALAASLWPIRSAAGFPEPLTATSLAIYLAAVVVVTFGFAYGIGSRSYFFAGLTNLLLASTRLVYELTGTMERALAWSGVGYFLTGLAWFALALLISAGKAGAFRRLAVLMPRSRARDDQVASRAVPE